MREGVKLMRKNIKVWREGGAGLWEGKGEIQWRVLWVVWRK